MTDLKKVDGFSIIDALFALVIFSLATFTYIHQVSMSNTAVTRQGNYISANIIAENLAEDLSMKGFGDPDLQESFNFNHVRYFSKNLLELFDANNAKYTAAWQVDEDSPIPGMTQPRC